MKNILEKIKNQLDINSKAYFKILKGIDNLKMDFIRDKKTVVLAGGFSTGKSSFINVFLDNNILPTAISPSTAIITYVYHSENEYIKLLNNWNNLFSITKEQFKEISYNPFTNIEFRHIIKNIQVASLVFPYKNLTFLDIPGYSKSQNPFDESQSDEEITKYYINESDLVLFFISGEKGTITEDDIKILKESRNDVKKLIILNKADKLTETEIMDVKLDVKRALISKGIDFIDVVVFSKKAPEGYDFKKIKRILSSFDTKENINPLKNIIEGFRDYEILIDRELNKESKRLYNINTAITLLDEAQVLESMVNLREEITKKMKELKRQKSSFRYLKKEFYTILNNMSLSQEFLKNTNDYLSYINLFKVENQIPKDFDVYKCIDDFSKTDFNIEFQRDINTHKISVYKSIKKFATSTDVKKISFKNTNYRENLEISIYSEL